MKKATANIECYKAGAKAFGNSHGSSANPHPLESAAAGIWNDGFLDRQKQDAYKEEAKDRKRAILHLKVRI